MSWYRGFENLVRERVPLACLTNYRVGGPAEFFAEPQDISALGHLLARAWNEQQRADPQHVVARYPTRSTIPGRKLVHE